MQCIKQLFFYSAWLFSACSMWGLSSGASAQGQSHCIGRSVFSTDAEIKWHLMDVKRTYPGNPDPANQATDFETRGMVVKYEYAADDNVEYFVSVEVSPEVKEEGYKTFEGMYAPNETDSKIRILKRHIENLNVLMSYARSSNDESRYESLMKEEREANDLIRRVKKVGVEIFSLKHVIELFKREGRPMEHIERELEAYEEEFRGFATDERYARERAFDFGVPGAFGAYNHGQLVVLLWRNKRIYKFAFGQANRDNLEWYPFFDEYVPAAHELLSRFRTREEFEIPQESGFCIPFGFIADDGRASYSINMKWHPVSKPSYLHNLKLDNSVLGGLDLLLIPTARVMSPGLPLGDLVRAFGPIPIEVGTRKGIMGGFYNRSRDPEVEPPVFTESYSIMGGQAAKGLEPSLVLEVGTSGSQEPLPFDEAQEAFKTILKSFQVLPAFRKAAVPAHP